MPVSVDNVRPILSGDLGSTDCWSLLESFESLCGMSSLGSVVFLNESIRLTYTLILVYFFSVGNDLSRLS